MKTNFFLISFHWLKSPTESGFGSTKCTTSEPVELLDYEQVHATVKHTLRDPKNPDAEIPKFLILNIMPMAPVAQEEAGTDDLTKEEAAG